jgi:hypothetical protein
MPFWFRVFVGIAPALLLIQLCELGFRLSGMRWH